MIYVAEATWWLAQGAVGSGAFNAWLHIMAALWLILEIMMVKLIHMACILIPICMLNVMK